MSWALFILGSYLAGSVPFGVLIARARGVDIRRHGSKNIGATNVGRVLGRRFGLMCFVLDTIKGFAPVLAAGMYHAALGRLPEQIGPGAMWLWLTVALATVCGHMFSIFLRFAGGKGVATAAGALAGMWPVMTIPLCIGLLVWVLVFRITRYVALASMSAAASIPLTVAFMVVIALMAARSEVEAEVVMIGASDVIGARMPAMMIAILLCALVVIRHRSNIGRLMRGEEPKAGGDSA